jgi:hypothetical protein
MHLNHIPNFRLETLNKLLNKEYFIKISIVNFDA